MATRPARELTLIEHLICSSMGGAIVAAQKELRDRAASSTQHLDSRLVASLAAEYALRASTAAVIGLAELSLGYTEKS